MEEIIRLNEFFPDLDFLGSRGAGEVIRKEMERIFDNKDNVILDFNKINSVTQSFGDEIIGIFVRAYGVEFIKKNVKVINASSEIRRILNYVVHYSRKYYAA